MACFGPDKPGIRQYGQEMQDTLSDQSGIAPSLYGLESEYQPKYTQLALGNAGISAMGSAGAAKGGLGGLYANLYPEISTATATGNLNTLQNLGAKSVSAYMNADPQAAGMLNSLTTQTGNELNMGANLDPSLMRLATQSVRSNQAGMLGGTGSSGTYGEALGLSAFGQNLRQQRRSNAGNVLNLRQQYSAPVLNNLMTGGTGATSQIMGMSPGISAGAGPSLFNPQSSYAGNLYGANQAYDWQYKQADPSTMARVGMVGQSVGSIVGGVAGAMAI